jgi:hypothetical protein
VQNIQNTELACEARQKKISVLALSSGFQAELTDSHSLQHSAMATGKTDGFLAVSLRFQIGVPLLRRLLVSLSLRRPGFVLSPIHVGFVVD